MKIQQADAYFLQALTFSATNADKLKGVWVTQGRLEVLLGQTEAQTALEEKWYRTKPGKGSQVLVFYTEETSTSVKEKKVSKEIKGGSQLEVLEEKQIILDGMMAGFNEGMTGEDDVDSDAMEEEEQERSTGIGCIGALKRPSGSSGSQSSKLQVVPVEVAEAQKHPWTVQHPARQITAEECCKKGGG